MLIFENYSHEKTSHGKINFKGEKSMETVNLIDTFGRCSGLTESSSDVPFMLLDARSIFLITIFYQGQNIQNAGLVAPTDSVSSVASKVQYHMSVFKYFIFISYSGCSRKYFSRPQMVKNNTFLFSIFSNEINFSKHSNSNTVYHKYSN